MTDIDKYRQASENNFQPITSEELSRYIGKPVHVKWAYSGSVWILRSISNDIATLETPTTHRTMRTRTNHLLKTRKESLND